METEAEVINIKKISKEEKEKIKRALKKKKNRKNKHQILKETLNQRAKLVNLAKGLV